MPEWKDNLEKLLYGANLDAKLRKALSQCLNELAEYQENLASELRARISTEHQEKHDNIEVVSFLDDCAENNLRENAYHGFFKYPVFKYCPERNYVPDPHNPEAPRIYFLKTTYDKALELLRQNFIGKWGGHTVTYALAPWLDGIEVEKELDLLWRLYGIKSMRPFLPWLRRAVYIRTSEPELDLCLAENGLEDILLADKSLFWNVEFGEEEPVSAYKIVPRDGKTVYRYVYSSCDGDLMLWPLPNEIRNGAIEPEAVDVEEHADKAILSSRTKWKTDSCIKLAFHEPEGLHLQQDSFSNHIKSLPDFMPKSRGDFNRILSGLRIGSYHCELAEDSGTIITRYQSFHQSRDRSSQLVMALAQNPVTVHFYGKNEGDDLFLTDYANWVLEELERMLPMFSWRGER